MKRARPTAATALVFALAACGETVRVEPAPGQILLYVDTDAPVPSAIAVAPSPDRPTPLFDRVRIELFEPGAREPCDGCVNEFELDEGVLRAVGASVGVAPPPGATGYRARVRMFAAAFARPDGSPDPDATVEVTVALPAVAATGKIEVTVFLATDAVGTSTGSLDEPIGPEPGRPAASQVGTWPGAERVPCATAPRPGEVCVPGGAFWMGGDAGPWSILPSHDGMRPRLVVLSPYFLDATEVTVAAYREVFAAPAAWSGGTSGEEILDYCTFTGAAGPRDDYPVNCVPATHAQRYCKRRGADLPTEAQWEYAAGGMFHRTYVWGEDSPRCEDAVFSRLGHGLFKNSVAVCRPPEPPGGPERVGSGARDRLELPTGTIVDLAGNVVEWMADAWNRSTDGCWAKAGVYLDPVCTRFLSGDDRLRSVRGGEWRVPGGQLARRFRAGAPGNSTYLSPEIGFRCARRAPR